MSLSHDSNLYLMKIHIDLHILYRLQLISRQNKLFFAKLWNIYSCLLCVTQHRLRWIFYGPNNVRICQHYLNKCCRSQYYTQQLVHDVRAIVQKKSNRLKIIDLHFTFTFQNVSSLQELTSFPFHLKESKSLNKSFLLNEITSSLLLF